MKEKVKQTLKLIIDKFKSGEIPQAVAMATFPIPDIPSCKWSFLNRTLMFLSGTADARGFRQWENAQRSVKKGSKAIYILVPCFGKKVNEETGEESETLRFFKASPVFRYEDTQGKELDYKPIELPDLPLLERAKEWGITVKSIPGNYRYHGYYRPSRKEIVLATPEESVFFHELSHAAHEKIKGKLKNKQDAIQEIVAELSTQALCQLVGKKSTGTLGNSYRYIESYANDLKLSPLAACLRVLCETEQVLNLILEGITDQCHDTKSLS